MRTGSLAAAAAFLLLIVAGPAGAATYTVSDAAQLQAALSSAAANPDRDTILIGPGSYNSSGSGFSYTAANSPIDIRGAGAASDPSTGTVLTHTTATPGHYTLAVRNSPGSTISGVRVLAPGGVSGAALDTDAQVDRSAFGGDPASPTVVQLRSGAALRHSRVAGESGSGQAVSLLGDAVVEDSRLDAPGAALDQAGAGAVTVRRARIDAGILGRFDTGGDVRVEDVLGVIPRGGSAASAFLFRGGSAVLHASLDHVTAVAWGQSGSVALGLNGSGQPVSVAVRNSVLTGFATTAVRTGSSAGDLSLVYSDLPPVDAATLGGTGSLNQAHDIDSAPQFAGPDSDDYRPAASSPLIDAGDPAGVSAGEQPLDLAGEPRVVDFAGNCVRRTDMGALERQAGPRAPRAVASAPRSVVFGADTTYDGSASCDPDGDALSYDWRFADGVSSDRAVFTRQVRSLEAGSGVLTVTDSTGRSDSSLALVSLFLPERPLFPGVGISVARVKVTRGRIAAVKLSCPAAISGVCSGTLALRWRGLSLGSRSFELAPAEAGKVRVRLTPKGFAKLRARRRLQASAAVTARDGVGTRRRTIAALTLVRPPRRR